jgi:DNA replication initiation complex subunit (GINS family)
MIELKITYEVLFDIFRREKNREELQKLDATFYTDVIAYLHEKEAILNEKVSKSEPKEEIKKLTIQLENIHKLLRELYDRRERKILVMALNKVRIQQNIINTSAMLAEEKLFFDKITADLQYFRTEILEKLIQQQKPMLVQHQQIQQQSYLSEGQKQQSQQIIQQSICEKTVKEIRFITAVPKFIGEEMEIYGPYQEQETASLPAKIADILIKKGRAEEVNNNEKQQIERENQQCT